MDLGAPFYIYDLVADVSDAGFLFDLLRSPQVISVPQRLEASVEAVLASYFVGIH